MLGFLEEVGEGAGVVLGLLEDAAVQESLAGRVEGAVQDGEELERGRREDLLVTACGFMIPELRARESVSASEPGQRACRRRKDAERVASGEEEKRRKRTFDFACSIRIRGHSGRVDTSQYTLFLQLGSFGGTRKGCRGGERRRGSGMMKRLHLDLARRSPPFGWCSAQAR